MSAVSENPWRRLAGIVSSPSQLWLLVRMIGWATLLPVLKRTLPLPRLVALMAHRETPGGRRPDRETNIVALVRRLYRSNAVAGRDNCLERSHVTYRYLTAASARPKLVVGMRKNEGELQGHVWVAVDGEAVHDAPGALADFVPVLTFRADGSEERSES